MPLTYSIEEKCSERQNNLTRLAFAKIKLETNGIVYFIETKNESDISIYCKPSKYGGSGEHALADASYILNSVSENLIEKGEINLYGQGQVCNTGYPALEVHEILHLFNIPHNPLIDSIMHPYSAESSSRCEITQIDPEYILFKIYLF